MAEIVSERPHATGHDWAAMGVPTEVATAQAYCDRFNAVLRMRAVGMMYRDIAARLNISEKRAFELAKQARRWERRGQPFNIWASDQTEFIEACRSRANRLWRETPQDPIIWGRRRKPIPETEPTPFPIYPSGGLYACRVTWNGRPQE